MEKLAVITTKFVLENNSPIVSVFKDSEGDWQFFGKEQGIVEEDSRVVSLEEILQIDPSIEELINMDNESHAWRKALGEIWNIEDYQDE
jgi:hypothetical protein